LGSYSALRSRFFSPDESIRRKKSSTQVGLRDDPYH